MIIEHRIEFRQSSVVVDPAVELSRIFQEAARNNQFGDNTVDPNTVVNQRMSQIQFFFSFDSLIVRSFYGFFHTFFLRKML